MRIEQHEIDLWMQPFLQKSGDSWPTQRTLSSLLRDGELHRFENNAHVLVSKINGDSAAHLISTTSFLKDKLPEEELAFIKNILTSWKPKFLWFAWLQRDAKMTRSHPAVLVNAGLTTVSKKKIAGWAIPVEIKIAELEKLIRG